MSVILTVLPLSCGWVDESKQLKRGDCFGVQIHPHWLQAHKRVRLIEGTQYLALSRASITDDKDGVPDVTKLFQLNNFEEEVVLSLQAKLLGEKEVYIIIMTPPKFTLI